MRFVVFIFIVMTSAAYSQVPYNIRLDNDLTQAHGKIVHELEDSYLCIGRGFNSGTSVGEGVYATEIDKSTGEVLFNTRFEIPNRSLFISNINNAISIDEKVYFLANSQLDIFLCYYDEITHEIINEKILIPQVSTPIVFLYDFHYKDGIFHILVSVEIGTTFKNSILLIKYDLENDTQTEIIIDDENIDPSRAKMNFLPNGNYLIQYSTVENIRELYVQEVNEIGNILWTTKYPASSNGDGRTLLDMGSDNFLIGGITRLPPLNSEFRRLPSLYKFNVDQRKFVSFGRFDLLISDYNNWNTGVREITPSHDSIHYLCVAELYNFQQDPDTIIGKGMVAKVDTNLNTIWRRSYSILDNNFVGHTLSDIIPTSDGNYLCYGKAYYYTIPPGEVPILSWVFKIDEDGKIVGDTTTATVDWVDEELIDQIEVFPNPASDMIYINQNEIDHVSYQVYDIDGRLEDEFSIDHKNESVMKPIDRWKKGYKIIRMLRDGRLIGSMKVLKI